MELKAKSTITEFESKTYKLNQETIKIYMKYTHN